LAEPVRAKRRPMRAKSSAPAEFRMQRVVVGHAVAMRAPGTRLEVGRGVEVANPEAGEVGGERGRLAEAEFPL
jgi:hypothetical protein